MVISPYHDVWLFFEAILKCALVNGIAPGFLVICIAEMMRGKRTQGRKRMGRLIQFPRAHALGKAKAR